MAATFGIVDLFAGPGGLGEGFSAFTSNGKSPFHIGISVEKEVSAHRTLTLRAFLREYKAEHGQLPRQFVQFHAGQSPEPNWADIDKEIWRSAETEARRLELGQQSATDAIDAAIAKLRKKYDDTVLIGGPPCQAYSLVGRARSRGKQDYVPENDHRHYLFREYIRVLDRLRPAAFVMENVKGMLSSKVESRRVFEMLMDDLSSLGSGKRNNYELRAIRVTDGKVFLREAAKSSDFIVRAEEFGVPQRRHRVIIVGIRSDVAGGISRASLEASSTLMTVNDAIGNLPRFRSGLSRAEDTPFAWRNTVHDVADLLADIHADKGELPMKKLLKSISRDMKSKDLPPRISKDLPSEYARRTSDLLGWLERPELIAISQHETRAHIAQDLGRYLFAAAFGETNDYSPKAEDYPDLLTPKHKNWLTGKFNDRFRVQLANHPATTVTSHISKDGHYFIHPDSRQCRSLTVREAARIQTFPDDYQFLGNRTQQYVQVGNAVPPWLAKQIAELVWRALKQHRSERH